MLFLLLFFLQVGVFGVGCRSVNERLKGFQITASAKQPKTETNNRGQEQELSLKLLS